MKKIFSAFLAAVLCVSLIPGALAADIGKFSDVSDNAWYAEAVDYAVGNGLFSGTSSTTFSPNASMTRAMFVTVLGRMSGLDGSTIQNNGQFADVDFDAYYGPSVIWAYENGVVSGTSGTTFSPDTSITREQIAVMIYRYLNSLDVQGPDNVETTPFQDATQISSYAVEAVNAMQEWGFIAGSNGNYRPGDNVSRAEAATILMRVDYFLETGEQYQPAEPDLDESETNPADAGFTVTTPSFSINSSVYDDEDARNIICGTIKITDFEEGFTDMQYVDEYFSESVKYTFESSDTNIIKVNEDGELYDPIRLENGAASVTAYITVTKVGAGSVKVPVAISPTSVWYEVDDEYIDEFATAAMTLVNQYRDNAGVQTVEYVYNAQQCANVRSAQLADDFSHTWSNPNLLEDYGVEYDIRLENIVKVAVEYKNGATMTSPEALAKAMVTALYNSEGHRFNMLLNTSKYMAMGLYIDPETGIAYSSQLFGSK